MSALSHFGMDPVKACALRLVCCTEIATTKDHVVPKSRGGKHLRNNTRPACRPCNQRKGNRLDDELTERDFRPGDPRRRDYEARLRAARLAAMRLAG